MSRQYVSKLSRRDSIKWMAAMASTAAGNPLLANIMEADISTWPKPNIKPVNALGYGQDPDMIAIQNGPWPLTLNPAQLQLVAVLSDIIIPAEGSTPAASFVGVPDAIDEWLSAPYPTQQRDRALLLPGLLWLDEESRRRFDSTFVLATQRQQLQIIDQIAFTAATPQFTEAVAFFDRLRTLVAGAFYSCPAGLEDLGYVGNIPTAGDYPGPDDEAMVHLNEILQNLGLTLPPPDR